MFTQRQAKDLLPKRTSGDNKTTGGRALILAGSRGMFGAAVLSATAAARVGSGYVTLATDKENFPSHRHPEFLIKDFSSVFGENKFNAVAVGPGLGQKSLAKKVFAKVLRSNWHHVVLDADALNLLAQRKHTQLPKDWILTPHEGELSRLIGISSAQIRADRKAAAKIAQEKFGCIVLLKGHRTLVAAPDEIFEIKAGNVALAKAGTGDVLTGIILGLLAQGLSSAEAACLGAFIHGDLADHWVRQKRDYLSLLPTDLLQALPEHLAKIRRSKKR